MRLTRRFCCPCSPLFGLIDPQSNNWHCEAIVKRSRLNPGLDRNRPEPGSSSIDDNLSRGTGCARDRDWPEAALWTSANRDPGSEARLGCALKEVRVEGGYCNRECLSPLPGVGRHRDIWAGGLMVSEAVLPLANVTPVEVEPAVDT